MTIQTIRWKNNRVELIDQRLLPHKMKYVVCDTAGDIYDAIKKMKIRGAPAIGIAASYGVYLGVRKSRASTFSAFMREVKNISSYLESSRPTAVNLFWACERVRKTMMRNKDKMVDDLKKLILKEANNILEEDRRICRAIGQNAKKLIKNRMSVLTHCNAGALATADYGTALGVIYSSRKKIKEVYIDETRPVLQGARLTAWELAKSRINSTLICDNMAASFMAKGDIDAIIVGADRIASNGDTANKIGTYPLAVLAKYHGIPFYVAAPVSTFDPGIPDGKNIKIELRDPDEVKSIRGKEITLKNIKVKNPAFDVTPAKLITAIVTELGIIRRPSREKIRRVVAHR